MFSLSLSLSLRLSLCLRFFLSSHWARSHQQTLPLTARTASCYAVNRCVLSMLQMKVFLEGEQPRSVLAAGETRVRLLYKTDELNQSNSSLSIGKERICLSRNWPCVRRLMERPVCVCVCVRSHLHAPALHQNLSQELPFSSVCCYIWSCAKRSAPCTGWKTRICRCVMLQRTSAGKQTPLCHSHWLHALHQPQGYIDVMALRDGNWPVIVTGALASRLTV